MQDFETIPLDARRAENVHYATDNRIRAFAQAMWRMKTGKTREDWLALGKDHPDNLIPEARGWVRAAVAASILEPPERDTEMDAAYEAMVAARGTR
ncbi:hypothetical protein [Streptomyces rubiginosohelvolus]|uniref:Uncharacterized protein n=1 Tax=Streptomyces rubiginosohelvolus TaxID=67362 RepID=A0ABQ3CBA4_9ACTN|nr:hypothetical protein [Streptomyces pluricolorescens]GGZ82827.1 hypothetical protein GCM10010328_66560 [Streptomyces pluricolorescens]